MTVPDTLQHVPLPPLKNYDPLSLIIDACMSTSKLPASTSWKKVQQLLPHPQEPQLPIALQLGWSLRSPSWAPPCWTFAWLDLTKVTMELWVHEGNSHVLSRKHFTPFLPIFWLSSCFLSPLHDAPWTLQRLLQMPPLELSTQQSPTRSQHFDQLCFSALPTAHQP